MQDIQIIYEDEDVVAINKPAGLLVHPAQAVNSKHEAPASPKLQRGERNSKQAQNKNEEKIKKSLPPTPYPLPPSLVDWLIEKYPEIKNVGDAPQLRPGIVHRLDKDTSGVLVVAKNQKAFEYLKKQFSASALKLSKKEEGRDFAKGEQERRVKKKYLALVHGTLNPPAGEKKGVIDLPIGKSKSDFRKKTAQYPIGKTREALTEYKIVGNRSSDTGKKYSLVEVWPKTGRTHQIRVHMKALGHPVVCDALYGPKKDNCLPGLTRQFLHANSLELTLPGGTRINLKADLPEDLKSVLEILKITDTKNAEDNGNTPAFNA